MKTCMRKIVFIFVAMLAICIGGVNPVKTEAAQQISVSQIEKKMDKYISWLSNSNKIYWNANLSEEKLKAALNEEDPDFSVGMTSACCLGTEASGVKHDRDCKVNNKAACTSNAFGGARQCRGFAKYFFYYLYGVDGVSVNAKNSNWTVYNGVPQGGLQAGDYVDCNGHAYIVRKVDSNGVIYAVHNNGSTSKKPCGVLYGTVYYGKSSSTESLIDKDSSCKVLRYNNIVANSENISNTQASANTTNSKHTHEFDNYGHCSCGTDFEIKTTKINNETYFAVKDDVPVRKSPYSPVKIDKYLIKGETVTVAAQGKNSKNNLWYKLSDGSWVFSENLSKSPVTFKDIVVKDNTNSKAKPYGTVAYTGKKPSSVGIYIGTSAEKLKKGASDNITHSKNPFQLWYTLKSETNVTPKKGTTYYFRFYAEIGGKTYFSQLVSFKAK